MRAGVVGLLGQHFANHQLCAIAVLAHRAEREQGAGFEVVWILDAESLHDLARGWSTPFGLYAGTYAEQQRRGAGAL